MLQVENFQGYASRKTAKRKQCRQKLLYVISIVIFSGFSFLSYIEGTNMITGMVFFVFLKKYF